jgi:CO/xanthine dehydrogenase Mo-binding subunit
VSAKTTQFEIEPERYELLGAPAYQFDFDRRGFLKVFGGGVAVLLLVPKVSAQESGRGAGRRGFEERMPAEIGAWLEIGEDGAVTVFTGKAEVGQNIRTSLTQAVGEELRAPLGSIQLVMGDTDKTPFDMGTFGSRTTPQMNFELRRVSSACRDLLVGLAAKAWNAEVKGLVAEDGKVTDPSSGRALSYGELARGRALAKAVVAGDPLRPASEWTVAGKSVPKIKGEDFVTGKHTYTPDVKRDGMLYGKVLRPPSYGATLDSLDGSAAASPTVTVVHDGDLVGVTAPSEPEAEQALANLEAKWKAVRGPSSRDLFPYLKANVETGGRGGEPFVTGSVEEGLKSADVHLDGTYTVAYIQHAPLEPRAAVAEWSGGKLTVWTGSQRPFGVRGELAEAFRIPEDHVRVIVPDTGAAYGGKHTGEAAIEAARLAKAAGRPVKLVWTREEEFTWAYFRPAGVIEARGGASHDGTLTAWEFHNYNSGPSAIRTPYEVANQRIEFHPTRAPLRQGSYRALAATANHFARESFMDELANALPNGGMDPLEFRLKNLKDERLRAVFQAAAEKFGWGKSKPAAGHGFGLGGGVEKNGYVATCAEVAIEDKDVRVVRVVTAFDCGAVVNPDGLKNQIAGANVMGLGGALFEAIEFEDGKILNNRFSKYRVPRFQDVPQIEVVLVDRKDIPSAGAGETPIVGLAPAVANAIFHATGTRLRSLPMALNGLKS